MCTFCQYVTVPSITAVSIRIHLTLRQTQYNFEIWIHNFEIWIHVWNVQLHQFQLLRSVPCPVTHHVLVIEQVNDPRRPVCHGNQVGGPSHKFE